MHHIFDRLQAAIQAEKAVALATITRGQMVGAKMLVFDDSTVEGTLGDPEMERAVAADARELLAMGSSRSRTYQTAGGAEVEVFIEVYPSPPTLLIFGGVHTAIPLTRFAKELGFRVRIVDPRGVFATRERFPEADEVLIEHPEDFLARTKLDSSSYVVILTHDPKFDEPALLAALDSDARYIGAIGSRQTNAARMERLRRRGIPEAKLERVHAPIGLNIGAQTPAEVALAIMAEIIAAKYGKTGRPLRESVQVPGERR